MKYTQFEIKASVPWKHSKHIMSSKNKQTDNTNSTASDFFWDCTSEKIQRIKEYQKKARHRLGRN